MHKQLSHLQETFNFQVNMKQQAIIKVQMNCDRCRTKAMKIAAAAECVDTVALKGKDRDQIGVTGDGFDVVALTATLKKKLGYASLVSVQELKGKHDYKDKVNDSSPPQWAAITCQGSQYPQYYGVVVYNDPAPTSNCSIM